MPPPRPVAPHGLAFFSSQAPKLGSPPLLAMSGGDPSPSRPVVKPTPQHCLTFELAIALVAAAKRRSASQRPSLNHGQRLARLAQVPHRQQGHSPIGPRPLTHH
ncbi:hypothetical protein NL676_029625 [Syzygium grande]|nr:hypothetical protein NL676_029625 [Syzygium grande]